MVCPGSGAKHPGRVLRSFPESSRLDAMGRFHSRSGIAADKLRKPTAHKAGAAPKGKRRPAKPSAKRGGIRG